MNRSGDLRPSPSHDMCKLLIQYGANVNAKDAKGNTPLTLSLAWDFTEDECDEFRASEILLE